LPSFTTVM